MEQLVLLVIIGLISLVNWVLQKAAEKREASGQKRAERREAKREIRRNVYTQGAPEAPRRGAAPQDPLKELMEALGLPPDAAALPRHEEPDEEFASMEVGPPPVPEPERSTEKPRWQPQSIRRPDEKMARLASAFAAVDDQQKTVRRGTGFRALLAGRDAQRKAVVVAEILGTPRGLASAGGRW